MTARDLLILALAVATLAVGMIVAGAWIHEMFLTAGGS